MTKLLRLGVSEQPLPIKDKKAISLWNIIQTFVVITLWASCYPLIDTGLAAFPPFHFATLRCVLAGLSLLIAGFMLKRSLLPQRDTWTSLIAISLTFTALGFTGMFLAGGRVTPGLATVIANIQPLLAALLGYYILTERITRASGLALLIGFVGIVVIAYPGLTERSLNSTPLGISLVLVGAIGVAIGNVLLKRVANRVDPLVAMAWILLLGAIPLAVAALIFEPKSVIYWSTGSIVNLLGLSIFGTALAFFLWLDLLRKIDLNILNAYTFLTPVIALLIGILFYNERLLLVEWSGFAIICFAVFLVSRIKKHKG